MTNYKKSSHFSKFLINLLNKKSILLCYFLIRDIIENIKLYLYLLRGAIKEEIIELYVNTNTPGAIQVVNLTSLTKSNDLENTTNETLSVEKPLTKKLTPPKDIPKNAGYANIFLTCITMIVSLILGISIATMIIK